MERRFFTSVSRDLWMTYLPWRRLGSWNCANCGRCCSRFKVVLWSREAEALVGYFGEDVVVHGKKSTMAKRGASCIFNRVWDGRSTCLLQNTGLKPSSCRIFPFLASPEPLRPKGRGDAYFDHPDGEVYIYANTACPSIHLGRPTQHLVQRILPEIAEIALDDRVEQVHTTSAGVSATLAEVLSERHQPTPRHGATSVKLQETGQVPALLRARRVAPTTGRGMTIPLGSDLSDVQLRILLRHPSGTD